MEYGLLGLAIIGTISALKMSGKVSGIATIVAAVILGALAGWGEVEGLTLVTGILTSLAAVGTITVVDKITK